MRQGHAVRIQTVRNNL